MNTKTSMNTRNLNTQGNAEIKRSPSRNCATAITTWEFTKSASNVYKKILFKGSNFFQKKKIKETYVFPFELMAFVDDNED